MQTSIREIRTRLLLLLVRAFVIVLSLSFVFFMGLVGYFLTSSSQSLSLPFAGALEGYYMGHGSWEGVEAVFRSDSELGSLDSILLDAGGRVVLDRQAGGDLAIGSLYEPEHASRVLELRVEGERVGYLVFPALSFGHRLGFARGILFPVGILSFVLGSFLVVVAILLVRRFVNPLADVIFAARSVAGGRLGTRISSEGPQDLRSLSDSFNEMAASLERNDNDRRNMLADIAHELRTPLSVIRGRLEGIVDGIYPESGTAVSTALEQTYMLERLVDDLRLLTLAETRQLAFDKRKVNIGEMIERILAMFSAEAQEKNVALAFVEKSGSLVAQADPQRMEQVISNLVSNAIRYVPEGGRVWVGAHEVEQGLRISINDNGPGIAEEDLPFIFNRFWRKDSSRSRVFGGSGLGLAITKQLVEAQGGKIEARNLPERGFQVIVELEG